MSIQINNKAQETNQYIQNTSIEQWQDWKWQMANRLNSIEDFSHFMQLTESEKKALSQPGLFRVDITPYFASLIDPHDPNCPIRRHGDM